MPTLGIVHTSFALVEPLGALARELLPGATVVNIVDDTLLSYARERGVNEKLTRRLGLFFQGAVEAGAIFIPTSRQYQLGEDVFMLLSLMDDPNRIAVQGKVVWITPEGVQGNRTQGIGVQFTQDETGAAARATIEKVLGETLASSRPTHTM